jgi:ribonuclease BN (tRNA processing enzyme)
MIVRVLGCSGAIAAGCKTTAFLLDDDVLVDAGTGVGDLTLDELAKIDHIVLSHSHLDHVLSIPLLADSVMRQRITESEYRPIHVHALPQTLSALRQHVFNGVIWPDFTRLPTDSRPILKLVPIEVGQTLELGGKRIEVLPAAHTVPAVGYAVDTPSGWWVYTGDTGPNPALWAALEGRRIAQLVIETAFGDDERPLADLSKHLAPSSLATELQQLAGSVPVHITHTKPGEREAVLAEIHAIETRHRIVPLASGECFPL